MKTMTKIFVGCFVSMVACSAAQADIVDFTIANAAQTGASALGTNPTLMAVSLGNGVTANIQAFNSNGLNGNNNFMVDADNGGLGVRANGAQLNINQLFQLSFTDVLLNGEAVPEGTTVDFTLNSYLFTDPTGRGFVFDGSNNLPSGLAFGADSLPNATSNTATVFDSAPGNASEAVPANLSALDLNFSTAVNADTYEIAPNAEVTFTNFLGIRSINPGLINNNGNTFGNDTFYFQGLDVTANVTVAIPEPSSMALLGLASLCLTVRRRK